MPIKAPLAAPSGYDWTGLYVGANAGYGIGRNPSTVGFPGFFGNPVPPPESFTQAPAGWLGGFQAGYNWQAGHLVLGAEGDWQWTGQRDTACVFVCDSETTVNLNQRLHSFGTVRGRLGLASGPVLFYATAGAAFANIDDTIGLVRALSGQSNSANFRHAVHGWVAGGGIEAALAGNWTAKVEYLHADFGCISDSFDTPIPPSPRPLTTRVTSDLRDHIIRVGVNYRLGGTGLATADSYAGMVTKAPAVTPVYNWTGFYVGGNAGYGLGTNAASLGQTVPPFAATPERFTLAPAGWLGGVQAGYNWHTAGNWVLGLEGDYQAANQKDSVCLLSCELTFGQGVTAQQRISWFSTLRGRAGYAAGPALFYLTGGLAIAEIKNDVQVLSGQQLTSASFAHTRTGWAAGGGVETALGGNWTARIEYLHMDLGNVSDAFVSPNPFVPNLRTSLSSDVHSHIVRLGLNYRLGNDPLVAKY
jgi:outer membrane immunogenic protein